MVDILFSGVFDSKIVNNSAEGDGTCVVPPYDGIQAAGSISMRCKEVF